jgi:hypothetical protein
VRLDKAVAVRQSGDTENGDSKMTQNEIFTAPQSELRKRLDKLRHMRDLGAIVQAEIDDIGRELSRRVGGCAQ